MMKIFIDLNEDGVFSLEEEAEDWERLPEIEIDEAFYQLYNETMAQFNHLQEILEKLHPETRDRRPVITANDFYDLIERIKSIEDLLQDSKGKVNE